MNDELLELLAQAASGGFDDQQPRPIFRPEIGVPVGMPGPFEPFSPLETGPQQSMPDDFWSRLALSGAQFQPPNMSRMRGGERVLGGLASLLAGYAQAKTGRARSKISQVEEENKRARDAASQLATWRHQKRLRDETAKQARENMVFAENLRRGRPGEDPEERAYLGTKGRLRAEGEAGETPSQRLSRIREERSAKDAARREHAQGVRDVTTFTNNYRNDPDVKGFIGIRDSYKAGLNGFKMGNSTGDLVLMRIAAKMTDPTTGVREEEFRVFKTAQGSLAQRGVQLTSEMVGKGSLTPAGRKYLHDVINGIYEEKRDEYRSARDFYRDQVESLGGDPKKSIRDYESRTGVLSKTPSGSVTPPTPGAVRLSP